MIRQHVRAVLLAGVVVATAAISARANDCSQPAPGAPGAPQTRTVTVQEWVPEKYETTRTVYTREQRQETYTAYRCETVQEERTRTCTVYHTVNEEKEVCRKVPVRVPCCEERTVMKPCYHYVNENKVVRKCVDKGHWECKEVPCGPSCMDRLKGLCQRHNDCCNDCQPKCEEARTKKVRCWVPCPVWEEHTVCCKKRVCEMKPVTCKVNTCKTEWREEKCKVMCCRRVPECKTEKYMACVQKKIPYQACRTVCVCVPKVEKVTCCRMVCHTVQKQVACETPCQNACCEQSCGSSWLSRFHSCSSHKFHHHGDCGGCGGCGGCN